VTPAHRIEEIERETNQRPKKQMHDENPFVYISDAKPEPGGVEPQHNLVNFDEMLGFEDCETGAAMNAREEVPREVEIVGAPSVIDHHSHIQFTASLVMVNQCPL
jgi:hypothetical protein